MIFEIEKIESKLNSFQLSDWKTFLDDVFAYKPIPRELSIEYSFATDYLFDLYYFIENNNRFDLANKFKTNLVQYYFELPIIKENVKKIYSLHWLFANIKINLWVDRLYIQFFNEELKGYYNENLNLQTSLLSLLETLPKNDNYPIYPYLMNNIDSTNDLIYIRVALRYLIQNESTDYYFNYLEEIIKIKQIDSMNEVIVESFMDFRKWSGSFQMLYYQLEVKWPKWCEINSSLTNSVALHFSNRYLVNGKKWFDNDIFARYLKPLVNSEYYPMPASYASELFDLAQQEVQPKKESLIKSLAYLISKKIKWAYSFMVDYDETDDYSLISVEAFDSNLESHFRSIYGIDKTRSYILNRNTAFVDFVTRNCDNRFNEIRNFNGQRYAS